jgi:hypothetical protein
VLFPIFVSILVAKEAWIEASVAHLIATTVLFLATHLLLQKAQTTVLAQNTLDTPPEEADEFPQRLGLRDSRPERAFAETSRPDATPKTVLSGNATLQALSR